jgi:hypothetical protein
MKRGRRNGQPCPSLETIDLSGARPVKQSPRSDAVLKAAQEIHRGGFAVTARAIADRVGEDGPGGLNRVHSRIEVLKKQGRWPFGAPEPAAPRYPATAVIAAADRPPDAIEAELESMRRLAAAWRETEGLEPAARRRVCAWFLDAIQGAEAR